MLLSINQHAKGILRSVKISRLRGVIATWNKRTDTLELYYFFNGKPTENEIEGASIVSTDILAGLPIASLEDNYIQLEEPTPLPKSEYWVYLK